MMGPCQLVEPAGWQGFSHDVLHRNFAQVHA